MKIPDHIAAAGLDARVRDLLDLPPQAFEAYALRLAEFLMSEASVGEAEAASAFLYTLSERERKQPGSTAALYARLLPAIGFVAASQQRFDAHRTDHGDFGERAAELAALFHRSPDELTGENQMLDASDDA